MTIKMNDSHIVSIAQIKEFLKINSSMQFKAVSKEEKYLWIDSCLMKFRYFRLRKKGKSTVKNYIRQMTGMSDARTTELISRKKKFGKLWLGSTKRHSFTKIYEPKDTALLIKTDNLHLRLSGPATKKILEREYEVFNKEEYKNISRISSSHIYNLRKTRQYQSHALTIEKTIPVKNSIGQRRKPDPQGKPGHLRVDSVHQGDLDKEKGLYHINIVDEITQWEIVGSVARISEYYLAPLLEDLLEQFPFVVKGFHSDNGGEFINRVVAELLTKLLIKQTKSRSRKSNDNALIEGKNGSIIRKHMGYRHIPKKYAPALNMFCKEYFNVYLNYHRPCGFAEIIEDRKGKQKKRYPEYMTPYDKLKSLLFAEQYLKPGISFKILDSIAYAKSDNEFADEMLKVKEELFKQFNKKLQFPTVFATFISGSYLD